MGKKVISIVTLIVMVAGLLTGCLSTSQTPPPAPSAPASAQPSNSANTEARVIKVSNGVAESHPAVIALREKFKKIVEEKTNGRYIVEVYFSNQLGDDTKATEALRAGTLESCVTSTAPLVGFAPQLGIFDIPFLFPDGEVADYILDGKIGQQLSDLMPQYGLINLAWAENGFRNLTNSVRDVKSPEDLKGLKIRTMDNKFHLEAWRLMGANPTPMSWSEVFTALQQKAIDGQENPVPNCYSARIQEVNKHWTITNHIYSPFMFLFSKKIWDTIPAEDQAIIREAAIETAKYERELNRQATIDGIKKVQEEGVTVTELTPEQLKAFQDKTAPVWDSVAKQVGDDFIAQLKEEIAKASK